MEPADSVEEVMEQVKHLTALIFEDSDTKYFFLKQGDQVPAMHDPIKVEGALVEPTSQVDTHSCSQTSVSSHS
jgi:hypothetical protein